MSEGLLQRAKKLPEVARKAVRLPPLELVSTLAAAVWIALAEAAVRVLPIARSARLFGVSLVAETSTSTDLPALSAGEARGVRAVRRLLPRIYGSERGCLRRSLVLGRVLRAHQPVMRIGVARIDGEFSAHAWIELGGSPIEDPGEHVAFDTPG